MTSIGQAIPIQRQRSCQEAHTAQSGEGTHGACWISHTAQRTSTATEREGTDSRSQTTEFIQETVQGPLGASGGKEPFPDPTSRLLPQSWQAQLVPVEGTALTCTTLLSHGPVS